MITDNLANVEESTSTYDLYSFDQAADKEWKNYRAGSFDLVNGQGYLYASKEGTELVFIGTPYSVTTKEVTLHKTDDTEADFPDWNLVGNPFCEDATIDRDCYVMNTEGRAEIVAADSRLIPAMEGAFVIATDNEDAVSFVAGVAEAGGDDNKLVLNLTKNNNLLDRAMVRFGEGGQLPKFQLNKNHTKVYIPQDGKDYAVVRSEEMGEMPVNFKAEENGTYSLSFSSENTEFAYLHLIDNMNGNDVDLLSNPSYSFEAKTTDYASRFKLVFATGSSTGSETFAFYSNGSFVISNEGNATLQVVDIQGRILKSESINGCTNVNVNAAPGVYMIRLVNSDNVKVQKVVVK